MPRTVALKWTKLTKSDSPYINGTNFQYLRTVLGCLKLLQVLLGAVCVGIIVHYMGRPTETPFYKMYDDKSTRYHNLSQDFYRTFAEQFFLIVAAISLVCTFCLLTACVLSFSVASIISKTIYEVIMHCVACVLYMVAVIIYFVIVKNERDIYDETNAVYITTAVIGTVNAILYLISIVIASLRHSV